MRLAELLAIVAVCPLGICGSACARIEQPIGQYAASTTRPGGEQDPTLASAEAPTRTQEDGRQGALVMDAGFPPEAPFGDLDPTKSSLPNPVLPTDAPFDGGTTNTGLNPVASLPRQSCYTGSVLAKRKRLDMYILMDADVTLPYSGAWEIATTGVREFVEDTAAQGIGVGLRYYGTECAADPYNLKPTVEVGLLPDNESRLVDSLNAPASYNASPMAFALQGGIMHQSARAQEHADWKQVVVLITDGFTQDLTCRYSLQDVQNAALDGFNAQPSIETYVIGYGAPDTMSTIADELIQRFSVLNSIARDGGGKLFSVKYNDDPSEMHDALTSIRRLAQPCAYEIPADMDPANLNLSFLPGSPVPRVDNRERCGQSTPGFFYTPEGAEKPTTIELCPGSCLPLQLNDFAALLYSGCPTVRR